MNLNTKQLKIGNLYINSIVSLAPLAGVTDYVLRKQIRNYSKTCLLTTEMISSEAIVQNQNCKIIYTDESEQPVAFQLEGHKPERQDSFVRHDLFGAEQGRADVECAAGGEQARTEEKPD